MPTPINADQINAYLAKTRKRGEYVVVLADFLSSKESALSYDLVNDFPGKKIASVKSGFVSAVKNAVAAAKEAGTEVPNVVVASNKDEKDVETVALINKDKI